MKEQALERKKFGPMLASSVAGVALSKASVDLQRVRLDQRPSLDAVAFSSPQLMGLTGELRAMTLAEFRRLGRDSVEAERKVLQKIAILSQESFEKKLEGIRAFRGSPLQGVYLSLVSESLRLGRPVRSLAQEKRAAGQDVLSPEEITSMISINNQLQF